MLVDGGTAHNNARVFVCDGSRTRLFTAITTRLSEHDVAVCSTRVVSDGSNCTLSAFVMLSRGSRPVSRRERRHLVRRLCTIRLRGRTDRVGAHHPPHRLRRFAMGAHVRFLPAGANGHALVRFITLSAPKLLTAINTAFTRLNMGLRTTGVAAVKRETRSLFVLASSLNNHLSSRGRTRLGTMLVRGISGLVG